MTAAVPSGAPRGRWVTLAGPEGTIRGYLAQPAQSTEPQSAVIVLHEAFGVNAHIRDVADRFAAFGHLALAPDLFHRSGVREVDYDDRATAMQLIDALGPEPIIADAKVSAAWLCESAGIPTKRTAVVGFCFGGRAAFTAATALPGLAATVVFYGPGIAAGPHSVLDRVAGIDGPVLILLGEQDPTIPPEHVAAIRDACRAAGVQLEIRTFADAGHAFHCDARPAMYHPQAARAAWQYSVRFINSALSGGGS